MDFSKKNPVMRLEKKNIPVLSEYAKDLEGQVKEWYVQKIPLVGVDPANLPNELQQFD